MVKHLKAASQGAKVAIFARRFEKLEEVAKEIKKLYPESEALAIKCDVTVESEVETAVKKVAHTFGKIDILINNAGCVDAIPIHMLPEEQWDKVIDTDLKTVFLASKHVLPYMLKAKCGYRISGFKNPLAIASFI